MTNRKHVVALLIWLLVILLLDVEFTEKVECNDSVNVDDNNEQHDGKAELLAIVRHRLEDSLQRGNDHRNVEQVSGKEKVTKVAQHRKNKVAQIVKKHLEETTN